MKKQLSILFFVCLLFSCSGDEKVCKINGRYASAPDGTVLYVTPVDDILSPIDSAVVKGGKFKFSLTDSVPSVYFLSSQQVIDGSYVVAEPGVLNVDFTGDVFVSGTPANECLNRFMVEKGRITNLRSLCKPEVMELLNIDEAMCDSLKELELFAGEVFNAYALKEIRENITSPVGCFYLLQSVGIVPSELLLPAFDKVPEEYRNKLYDAMKKRVKSEVRDAAIAEMYIKDSYETLAQTAVGKRFQNFELENINGGKISLADEVAANSYTLVLFWASWQKDVKELLAVLVNAYNKYKSDGLQVVGVSLDNDVSDCKAIVDELGISWPQLCDATGSCAEVAASYGVTELPSAAIINHRGTILARTTTVDDILKKIEELF